MTLVKFNKWKVDGYSTFNELINTYFKGTLVNDESILKLPAVNIFESENYFRIELAAPGLKKEEFKIAIDEDVLTISSEKKTANNVENRKTNRKEFS